MYRISMINKVLKFAWVPVAVCACLMLTSLPASAQGLNNSSWSPQQTNRASVAALIKQVENEDEQSGMAAASAYPQGFVGSSVTQLICGSTKGEGSNSSSSSQANSSCIIINDSENAGIVIEQDSEGDQIAETKSNGSGTIDETDDTAIGDALEDLTADDNG